MKRLALVLLLIVVLPLQLQAQSAPWCGYALIEGVENVQSKLPLLSRLTVDATADANPADLFQTRISLDGTKAIIEGCWLVFPTRELILNWLNLSVGEDVKQSVDEGMVYSLFAPDRSREDASASVRAYLAEHRKDWEEPLE